MGAVSLKTMGEDENNGPAAVFLEIQECTGKCGYGRCRGNYKT
jgi:hypothetical protein